MESKKEDYHNIMFKEINKNLDVKINEFNTLGSELDKLLEEENWLKFEQAVLKGINILLSMDPQLEPGELQDSWNKETEKFKEKVKVLENKIEELLQKIEK